LTDKIILKIGERLIYAAITGNHESLVYPFHFLLNSYVDFKLGPVWRVTESDAVTPWNVTRYCLVSRLCHERM